MGCVCAHRHTHNRLTTFHHQVSHIEVQKNFFKINDIFNSVKNIPLKVKRMQRSIDFQESITLFLCKCNPSGLISVAAI